MASALHGLGRRESAQAAYESGLSAAQRHLLLHPEDARALYFGANALSQIGDKERSLEWATRAQVLEPDEPQVLHSRTTQFRRQIVGRQDLFQEPSSLSA